MRMMDAAKEAPSLASAMNIGAFNFANAIGAALGVSVINAGHAAAGGQVGGEGR